MHGQSNSWRFFNEIHKENVHGEVQLLTFLSCFQPDVGHLLCHY